VMTIAKSRNDLKNTEENRKIINGLLSKLIDGKYLEMHSACILIIDL
jgi:hypothetical protein